MKKTCSIGLDLHKETIAIGYTFFGSRSKAVYHGECASGNRAAEATLRKLAKKLGIKFKELNVKSHRTAERERTLTKMLVAKISVNHDCGAGIRC